MTSACDHLRYSVTTAATGFLLMVPPFVERVPPNRGHRKRLSQNQPEEEISLPFGILRPLGNLQHVRFCPLFFRVLVRTPLRNSPGNKGVANTGQMSSQSHSGHDSFYP